VDQAIGREPVLAVRAVDEKVVTPKRGESSCTDNPGRSGQPLSPRQAAEFTNAVQRLREATRLGIPALFKSKARNHIDPDARVGISESVGAFSAFPKEPGIAAAALGAGSMGPMKDLATMVGGEWRSIGLRGMYAWSRYCLSESPDGIGLALA
jgi:beta-glucosidase